ncbi:MAG: hypothetical protein FJZ59_03490 [Chlamydiae bacterium]|jgi:hypothetical protein|nr:hypothetical protein [Chlamydiota bacterium]
MEPIVVSSPRQLIQSWLQSVQENATGAPEDLTNLTYLDKSRKPIISPLWENPQIALIVKKVQIMVASSIVFDPTLFENTKAALAVLEC